MASGQKLQEVEASVSSLQQRLGVEQEKRMELEDLFYRLGEEAGPPSILRYCPLKVKDFVNSFKIFQEAKPGYEAPGAGGHSGLLPTPVWCGAREEGPAGGPLPPPGRRGWALCILPYCPLMIHNTQPRL